MPQEGMAPWLLSPLLEAPGKGEHFIPPPQMDVHAIKGGVPFGHMAIMLKHAKARELCPIGLTCLGELQFTCHCHILCEQLGIPPMPPGHCNHFLPPCWGILNLFYSPIHPPSMLQYWIRSSLWHCCSKGGGPPLVLAVSAGIFSCSLLALAPAPSWKDLSASTPSFRRLVYFLRLLPLQKLSQPAIQARRLA